MKARCRICPHGCLLEENQTGLCRARRNAGGVIKCVNYGKLTSLALDPIEKKPLYRFYPGSMILSAGSFGCNFTCGFCQNHGISTAGEGDVNYTELTPVQLADKAEEYVPMGNIGVAYTYNEPLIGFEFVLDCAKEIRARGLKNVLVTNGYINKEPLLELLPFTDAMNIDLKSFGDGFYKKISGDSDTVKNTVKAAYSACHIEITTLVIPGENDSEEEITAIAEFLAGIDREIPYHISRFFPRYKYGGRSPADVKKIYRLADTARRYLTHVYTGNC